MLPSISGWLLATERQWHDEGIDLESARSAERKVRMSLVCKFIDSPVGKLKLVASEKGLVAILWENDNPRRVVLGDMRKADRQPILDDAERQLKEYFAGRRQGFSIPLDMRGTPFQQSVWEALLAIPFGETRSYGQLAKQLGKPTAMRAVGAANGRNPISIVVPCHRVIGSSGQLIGFAGGLEAKERLLKIESESKSRLHHR
jgi:methylated-DNA-[protein]-cysteine S-methyltransferase